MCQPFFQKNGLRINFVAQLQGAGGVGGLLSINTTTNGVHLCTFDGNGNAAALVNGVDGTLSGVYEHDPFGNALRMSGAAVKANQLRFSTQFADEVLGTTKYLYRDHHMSSGRWLSRDPIEEVGVHVRDNRSQSSDRNEEKNLYSFIRNNVIDLHDQFGLKCNGNGVAFQCPFNFNVGTLTVSDNCKGKISMWVIAEDPGVPAGGATAGGTVSADGYVLGGTMYKIDGSTCAEIDCTTDPPIIVCCMSLAAKCAGRKCPPYKVPSGTFGAANEPPSGVPPPVVK